jgi:D-sedoheptulose 7-phosphate isomerase
VTVSGLARVRSLSAALSALERDLDRFDRWGAHAARTFQSGGRLLAVGNGGSAAQAQHLTGELVGRFRDDRRPLDAIALCAETVSLTAIVNDYGTEEMFARAVRAHGRRGDVLVALSTSGRSPNVVAAARAARELRMTVWCLCGRRPNPLDALADDAVCIDAPDTATVQELHLVSIHLFCETLDIALGVRPPTSVTGVAS